MLKRTLIALSLLSVSISLPALAIRAVPERTEVRPTDSAEERAKVREVVRVEKTMGNEARVSELIGIGEKLGVPKEALSLLKQANALKLHDPEVSNERVIEVLDASAYLPLVRQLVPALKSAQRAHDREAHKEFHLGSREAAANRDLAAHALDLISIASSPNEKLTYADLGRIAYAYAQTLSGFADTGGESRLLTEMAHGLPDHIYSFGTERATVDEANRARAVGVVYAQLVPHNSIRKFFGKEASQNKVLTRSVSDERYHGPAAPAKGADPFADAVNDAKLYETFAAFKDGEPDANRRAILDAIWSYLASDAPHPQRPAELQARMHQTGMSTAHADTFRILQLSKTKLGGALVRPPTDGEVEAALRQMDGFLGELAQREVAAR